MSKQYIKKFASASAANDYPIVDIPFTTTVIGGGGSPQNLTCNQEGMKLVNNGGTITVESAGPSVELVDLGLSVKWMKYNLGATGGNSAQSWYGGYYAWAETSGRTVDYEQETCSPSCDWAHYKYYANGEVSKYNETDGLTTLQAGDDVITATYGAGYSMPTKAEIGELTGLTNEWVEDYQGISGLNGRLFHGTGAYSANTLFIPAAGYCLGGDLVNVANVGCVWSSSLNEDDSENAWRLRFYSGDVYANDYYRYYGYSVRGVSRS